MRKYPISVRVWGLATVALPVAYTAWEYRGHPRVNLWGHCLHLPSSTNRAIDVLRVVARLFLVEGFMSLPAWLIYTATFSVARRLTRRRTSNRRTTAPRAYGLPPPAGPAILGAWTAAGQT